MTKQLVLFFFLSFPFFFFIVCIKKDKRVCNRLTMSIRKYFCFVNLFLFCMIHIFVFFAFLLRRDYILNFLNVSHITCTLHTTKMGRSKTQKRKKEKKHYVCNLCVCIYDIPYCHSELYCKYIDS